MKNSNWLFFAIAGVEFGVSVIAGLLLGGYADSKLDTSFPLFTLIGLVCGVSAGLTLLLRTLKLHWREKDGPNERP